MNVLILFIVTIACVYTYNCLNRTVYTTSGRIRGTTSYFHTTPVQTFFGIPYAQPPTGHLRFKKTLPVEPWSGILTADHMTPACMQYTTYPFPWYNNYAGKSEDCLYMNVWVPSNTKEGDEKAVIFWIHGGGYMFGSNRKDITDGRVMATFGDVIVVAPNYRLGLFGFLTSGTDEAPGNNGLYDILEALKWVNANIASFGGDPSRITIQGESVGAATVSALCISPLTKGLFSRAILQSESILFFTADLLEPDMELGQKVAKAVGCASDDLTIWQNSTTVVDCLRGRNAKQLTYALYTLNPVTTVTFGPIYGDEFLPRKTSEDLNNGNFHDVPLLIGNLPNKGSFLLTTFNPSIFGFFGEKDPVINKTLGEHFIRTLFKRYPDLDGLIQHYLGYLADDDYDSIRTQVFTVEGDMFFTCVTKYFAEKYSAFNNNVYYYMFSHRPSTSLWAPWMGKTHFEDVQFTFGFPLRKPWRYEPEEVQLSSEMIHIWSHFAKYGSPPDSYNWPKYSREYPVYVILDTKFSELNFGIGPNIENCNYLRDFYGVY